MAQPTFYTESADGALYTAPGTKFTPTVSDTVLQQAQAPDTRGEISKGISRGVDTFQALGYGAAGVVSDALGNKTFAQTMFDNVQRNLEEAAQSPAAVPNFSDIGSVNGYPKDAWDWFWGAAAEALPSSVASLATSGAGALLFRAAASKLATDALAKRLVSSEIRGLMAKGVTEQAAKQQAVKQFFANELKQQAAKGALAGSYVGGALTGTALESGSNWIDDVEKRGIQDTAPLSDMAYGLGGGLIEAGIGPERQLIGKLAQDATKRELTAAAKRGVLGNLAVGIGKASAQEGAEEFGQQMLSQMSLARDPLTQQNWKDNFNALAGGAAGGALFGVAGGTQDAFRGSKYKAAGGLEEGLKTDPSETGAPSKATQLMLDSGIKTGVVQAQANQHMQEIDQSVEAINKQKSALFDKILEVHSAANIDAAQKDKAIKQYEDEAMALTAQLTNLTNQKTEFQKGLDKEMAKLDKQMVDASAMRLSEQATMELYNTMTPEQKGKMAVAKGIADEHANKEVKKANTRVSQHLAAIKALEAAHAQDRANGWGLTQQDTDTIKWHEQQIKDETNFINQVKKNYKRALEEASVFAKGKNDLAASAMGVDLRGTYRAANHATDAILSHYTNRTNDVVANTKQQADLRSKLAAKAAETRTVSKLDKAFKQAVSPRTLANHAANMQYAQDFNNLLIEDDINTGVLPGVVQGSAPYIDMAMPSQTIAVPTMDSVEFSRAMDAPRISNINDRPVQDVVSDFNGDPATQLNKARAYNLDTYGNINERNVDPRQYANQEERARKEAKRQQLLGAMQAWKANTEANKIKASEDTKQAAELNNLWHKLDANAQAPAAALAKQKVVSWIKGTMQMLPVLRDITKVVHGSEINTLPEHVQKEYIANPTIPGLIDLKNSTIYLFSNNIYDARTATRTVVHEGVAHFGLRAIMSPDQLENFFRMVARGAEGEDRWDVIKEKYADYNMYGMAEEYIADIAERVHLSKIDMPSARRAWTKIYYFLRDLLTKLGWIDVTKADIDRVIMATVYHLVNMDPDAIKRNVAAHAEYNARSAMGIKYEGFHSPLLKHIESINIKPTKQMPVQYWFDQIWPSGNLRKGLSEEEMQYFNDVVQFTFNGAKGNLKTALEEASVNWTENDNGVKTIIKQDDGTLNKTELLELLNMWNDTFELKEEIVETKNTTDEADAALVLAFEQLQNKIRNIQLTDAETEAILDRLDSGLLLDNPRDYFKRLLPGNDSEPTHNMNSGIYRDIIELLNGAVSDVIGIQRNSALRRAIAAYWVAYSAYRLAANNSYRNTVPYSYYPLATDGGTNNRNFAMTAGIEDFSSHDIGQDNTKKTVFHIRTSDYTDAQGNKVLHIEEIQSDRIQKGLEIDKHTKLPKRGFKSFNQKRELKKVKRQLNKDIDEALVELNSSIHPSLSGGNNGAISWDDLEIDGVDSVTAKRMFSDHIIRVMQETPNSYYIGKSAKDARAIADRYADKILDMYSKWDAAGRELNRLAQAVPWTPLVKSYPTLALKRMLKFAAENGYDKISWTPGIQQVDRYTNKLRARVESISWQKTPSGSNITAVKSNDGEVIHMSIYDDNVMYYGEMQPIEDVFGKDIARQIIEQPAGHIANDGLAIGGKGFVQFYDNELVNNANKYIKKLDSTQKVYDTPFAGYNMHSFNITDEMREKIAAGQPTYGTVVRASRPDIIKPGAWTNVRQTPAYEKKFGFIKDLKDSLKRTTYRVDANGKIIPGSTISRTEQLVTGLHNSFDRGAQLVHKVHGELRKKGSKVTMDENFAEVEKTTHNRVATTVGDFLTNVVGMDPSNWAHTPADGTLFNTMAQLVGSNKEIPKDPKELLFVVGKVLQAMHAEEANAELVRKQYKSSVMKSILQQVEELESELDSGKATTDRVAKIERRLSDLYSQAESVASDIRHDLSGMSNAEAKSIMNKYITPNNVKTWEEISYRVQSINKTFLDMAVENHLLSPEMRNYWDKLYQNYVPLDVWEAHMRKVDPGFASMGRSFDMGMFELSKERKGNSGTETNPLVLLTRKYTQLVQAVEQARVGTALLELFNNHPEYLTEILEKDNSGDARVFSAQIKELLANADKLLGGKSVASTKEAMRGLRRRISELNADKAKAMLQSRAAKSADTKAKFQTKVLKIEADIKSANDAIDVLKQNLEDIKANPEYISIQEQIKELRTARLRNWNSRGYKIVIKDGKTYKVRKSNKFEGRGAEIITVFDKAGNKVRLLVKDQYLLAALKGTSMVNPGPVVRFLGTLQRHIAQLMTTYAPPFIAVNWFRDTTTALIHMRNVAEDIRDLHWSGNQADEVFLKNVFGLGGKSAFRAAMEYERNNGKISDPRMAKMMALYRKYGGYTSMYGMSTYEATQKNMERALKAGAASDPKKLLFATANLMQDVSSAVENSTRLAAFTSIFEALIANGVSEEKAATRAATAALDLTVNFTKRGNWSPVLSSLFLFSQASINSTVRIAKAMFPESDKGKPVHRRRITKYVSGLAAFGFMAALAAKAMGGTDDDGIDFYDKLPEYVRNTNIVIAVGKNRFIRIPVTFGYQAFVSLGSTVADMYTGRATAGKAMSGMFGSIMNNFSFIGGGDEGVATFTPTLFKPFVQVYANQNYFGGKVHPESGTWKKGEQPDSQKYWSTTTEIAKTAALWLNALGGGSIDRKATLLPALTDLSPASIEHIFKQYTGGIGQFLLSSISAAEKVGMGRTEKLTLDQLPIASRFMSHVDNSATMSEYARVKTELETQINIYKRAKASRLDASELAAVLKETKAGRLLGHRLNSVQNKLSDMKADLNKLELASSATTEDVYKKRIANEEKAAILVKQLIKQARVVGVK